MLRWFISKKLDAAEKELGGSLNYLRYMLKHSMPSFLKFSKIMPLAQHRKKLPIGPYCAAGLVATRHEDCGTCVQIGVNLSRKAGVDPKWIKAILEDRWDELPEDMADACRFADAVVKATYEEVELREKIRQRHGDEGLIEMCLAITTARMFPTLKRGLGFAVSCSRVKVEV